MQNLEFSTKAFAAVTVACAVVSAAFMPAPQSAAAPVPVLVELFTSEGCSSCPPADELLITLTDTQPVDGAIVIGLSEHVDYWDQQGWRDPFSSAAFTARQNAYGQALKLSDIYTPQLIVDGAAQVVGSDRAAGLAAIRRAAGVPKAGIRLAWQADGTGALDIALDSHTAGANADVFLAITEDGLRTSVKRGENQGRELRHAAVVRRLVRVGQADRHGALATTTRVTFLPAWNRRALHVVAFAQAPHTGRVTAIGIIRTP